MGESIPHLEKAGAPAREGGGCMAFFDLHTHMLCGVDDGAATEQDMHEMLRIAYEDGTRAICLTPHYSPYLFGDTSAASERAFERLREYAAERYPDLTLYLGHELGYHDTCVQALNDGRCRTLNGSRYLLVDFPAPVGFSELREALERLLRIGYRPVLAHAERYRSLWNRIGWLRGFVESGGVVQLNAGSAAGAYGRFEKRQWKRFLKHGLVQVVSSDGHNTVTRTPQMSVCLPMLEKFCTPEEIEKLTWSNALTIVNNGWL